MYNRPEVFSEQFIKTVEERLNVAHDLLTTLDEKEDFFASPFDFARIKTAGKSQMHSHPSHPTPLNPEELSNDLFDPDGVIPVPGNVDDSTKMKKEFSKVCANLIDAYCGLIGMHQTEFNENRLTGSDERRRLKAEAERKIARERLAMERLPQLFSILVKSFKMKGQTQQFKMDRTELTSLIDAAQKPGIELRHIVKKEDKIYLQAYFEQAQSIDDMDKTALLKLPQLLDKLDILSEPVVRHVLRNLKTAAGTKDFLPVI